MLHNSIPFLATQTLSAAAAHHPAAPESRQSPVPAHAPASDRQSALPLTDDGSEQSQSGGHPATAPQCAAVSVPADLVKEQADDHARTYPPGSPPSADASPLQRFATAAEPGQDGWAPDDPCAASGKPQPVSGATATATAACIGDHSGQGLHPPDDSCALPEPGQANASCSGAVETVCGQDQQLPEVPSRPDPGSDLVHTFPVHGAFPQVTQTAATLQAACTSLHAAHDPAAECDALSAADLEERDPGRDLSRAGSPQSFPGQQNPLTHASCLRHAKDPQELSKHRAGADPRAQLHWHVLDTDKCPAAVAPAVCAVAAERHSRLQPPAPQHPPPAAATAAAGPVAQKGKRKAAADTRPPAKLRRMTRSQVQQPLEPADSSLLAPLQEVDEVEAQAGSSLKEDATSMDRHDGPCFAGHATQVSSCSPAALEIASEMTRYIPKSLLTLMILLQSSTGHPMWIQFWLFQPPKLGFAAVISVSAPKNSVMYSKLLF